MPTDAPIVAISGTGSSDLWLVDARGRIYQLAHGSVARQWQPCTKLLLMGTEAFRASTTDVILVAHKRTWCYNVSPFVVAQLRRSTGTWRCDIYPPVDQYGQVSLAVLPATVWIWAAGNSADDKPTLWSLNGIGPNLPKAALQAPAAFAGMPRVDRGWLAASTCPRSWTVSEPFPCPGPFWEFRGSGWISRPSPGIGVVDVWQDETGGLWAVGSGIAIYRAGAWQRLAVPEDFRCEHVVGTSASNVWCVAEKAVYQWDGAKLHRSAAPMPVVRGAFMTERGELWLVGHDEAEWCEEGGGCDGGQDTKGMVFRVRTGQPLRRGP